VYNSYNKARSVALSAFLKGGDDMQENGIHGEFLERFQSPEAIRLLWEGTRKALDGGMDHDDLVSLCDIIVRIADHRLLLMQAKCDPPSAESEAAAEQLRLYRKMASELLQWAKKPAPEPNWAAVAENLKAIGAAPLK
jgi:hypothetical protein